MYDLGEYGESGMRRTKELTEGMIRQIAVQKAIRALKLSSFPEGSPQASEAMREEKKSRGVLKRAEEITRESLRLGKPDVYGFADLGDYLLS